MDNKISIFPYICFLTVLIPAIYFAIQWPSYYQAILTPVQEIPQQIFIMFLIYFTPAWAIFLSLWSIYQLYLMRKNQWYSNLKIFNILIPLFVLAIIYSSIHHWYMAVFTEGIEISWFRYYSQPLHFSFISQWSNLFIVPVILLILMVSLAYYLSRPKMVKNTISFIFFSTFFIFFIWLFLLNLFYWSSEFLNSIDYEILLIGELFGESYTSGYNFFIIRHAFNPIKIFQTFFSGVFDFFIVSRFSASDFMTFILAIKSKTEFDIGFLQPTLTFLFYARLLIMLALTAFLGKLHQLHQKI